MPARCSIRARLKMDLGMDETWDAVVIGGGFYGAAIAIYLAKSRGLRKVLLLESGPQLLQRASFNNQARVHNGYHYPRSFTTAYRSRVNFPRFVTDWPEAVRQDFVKLYAIARRNSKVTAKQFVRFCNDIGAQIEPAQPSHKALFEKRLIEDVFLVKEYAFDSTKLADWAKRELLGAQVAVRCNTRVTAITLSEAGLLAVTAEGKDNLVHRLNTRFVFNCTYSGVNQFGGDFPGVRTGIKQEITEMALLDMPNPLKDLGITVMDGPFFSLMPFPARGLHTLSHVRYTPHTHWDDERGIDPYERLRLASRESRANRMIRDVYRYIPSIAGAKQMDSLFEVKTVLMKNEGNDGRPILFEKYPELPGCYTVLGGKIDNIYDVLEKLDVEDLRAVPAGQHT